MRGCVSAPSAARRTEIGVLAFAEAEALRRGYREIRLYTHQTMVENQRLYASIGYEETGRGTESGFDRIFMRKLLREEPVCEEDQPASVRQSGTSHPRGRG
jgi:hypothetical protein